MRHTIAVVFVVFCAGLGVVRAQPADPQAFVESYIAAFNGGESPMRAFFETQAAAGTPIEARLQRFRQMQGDFGALTLRRIVSTTPQAVTAEITGTNGTLGTFVFTMTLRTPPKLQGISVRLSGPGGSGGPGDGPGEEPPLPPRDAATAMREIADRVGTASAADEFAGAVLIARGGAVVWETATGFADREAKVANTIDTRFNVGSIGKAFTQVAVAQLVAAGKIRPDDTVGRFLPDYPNAAVRDSVTVRMLLDMRSGIGDIFGPAYQRTPKASLRTLRDYLPLFASEPLLFTPGQGQQYSNGGYVVLGLIVQQASGMDYYDYVQRRVFEIAGMRASGFFAQSDVVARRAHGYTTQLGGARQVNAATLPERASSAGGAYSTTHDLLRFEQALAAGTLVAPAVMQQIGRGVQGLGLAGGAPGLNATLDQDVNGYTVVVMANEDPPAAERLARAIRRVVESVRQ